MLLYLYLFYSYMLVLIHADKETIFIQKQADKLMYYFQQPMDESFKLFQNSMHESNHATSTSKIHSTLLQIKSDIKRSSVLILQKNARLNQRYTSGYLSKRQMGSSSNDGMYTLRLVEQTKSEILSAVKNSLNTLLGRENRLNKRGFSSSLFSMLRKIPTVFKSTARHAVGPIITLFQKNFIKGISAVLGLTVVATILYTAISIHSLASNALNTAGPGSLDNRIDQFDTTTGEQLDFYDALSDSFSQTPDTSQ